MTEEDNPADEILARLDSLEAWSTPIVSCTVDTVLGLVQNNRRGLYGWPALAGAAFVFDEIHSYDEALFSALLRFLKTVRGVPVLLMTASLPGGRLQALRQLLAEQAEGLREIAGPEALERLPRYHRLHPVEASNPLAEVQTEVGRGGKVLWVCNTVDRVLKAADKAKDLGPLIYHSRFRYEDRVQRHAAVVDAFKNPGPALACCSQVAEMSLDLSATLLVTDLAPVPALIQRLGRLNRRAQPAGPGQKDPPTQPFLVIEPLQDNGSLFVLPYTEVDFDLAQSWLAALGEGPLAQTDLTNMWQALGASVPPKLGGSVWLDGGPRTTVVELREASPGLTVVLDRDLPLLKKGEKRLVEVALPMPAPGRLNWKSWPTYKGVPVAPAGSIDYDPYRGGRWQK